MENKVLVPGRVVESTAGRDAGKLFLVVGVISATLIQVADGRGRKIDQAKKKNVKHVKPHAQVAQDIAGRLGGGLPVTDADIRAALETLTGTELN
ncbi:MAG: KOW domain-containing RNA-binding protein [Bacillota bacterium]